MINTRGLKSVFPLIALILAAVANAAAKSLAAYAVTSWLF